MRRVETSQPTIVRFASLRWLVLGVLVVVLGVGGSGVAWGAPVVERLAGSNRYATSAAIAAKLPVGKTVFVAKGTDFPDALAGGAAAAKLGGALLLVDRDSIPVEIAGQLKRLKPSRIVVLGSSGSVSARVFTALRGYSSVVVRAAGSSRLLTAVAVSKEAFTSSSSVIIANGMKYPDALSAASLFSVRPSPVLLASASGRLDAATFGEVRRLKASTAYVLGSEVSVPKAVVSQLEGAGVKVVRLAGGDRFATSLAIAKRGYPSSASTVYFTTGMNYPDGLSVGPLVARNKGPLLLVPGGCVPRAMVDYVKKLNPSRIVLLGSARTVGVGVGKLEMCPLTDTTTPDVGTMPAGFSLRELAGTNNVYGKILVVNPCRQRKPNLPSLAWRTGSRNLQTASETYESGANYAAYVMVDEAKAKQLMAEIRGQVAKCGKDPAYGAFSRLTKLTGAVPGAWDDSLVVGSQLNDESVPLGATMMVARNGNKVVVHEWWTYYHEPLVTIEPVTWDDAYQVRFLMQRLGG